MQELIDEIRALDQSGDYPSELPTDTQLVEVEEIILIPMPSDLRAFQLTVSNVIFGSLEPVTISDPYLHTYLPEVAANAWNLGLPREYIPICQTGDNFYFVSQEGEVGYWQGQAEEDLVPEWDSIWDWVTEVWMES
ncbi:SMI1/KNR4 family protein [Agarivorans sp. MS3-6]|uniref:SMI1/KNR4 family protein n=1 Tax=Agarivorans sp. TSD2052 TaxID=2937286 RepID=UPI00200CE8A2|nr:SMI1/KNR4 family protein [Agarivorans sp. TSD2052]UPW18724.1 SMI1/KNR4 family protein [Agarivorans sp. TSD2052]